MSEQGTSYLNAEASVPPKQRMVITLNAHGLPVGENSTKLSSRCGHLVRTIVPISYKDWHAVPNEKKDELWKLLLEDFDVSQSYKDKCLRSMAESMRKYKTKLRMQYLDPHKTQEEKLKNRPPGVRPEDWEAFIKHNADPKTIEQRQKNQEMRKKMKIYHTSGRHGHARLAEKMKRQRNEDAPPITRAEVWIEAHKRKDGSIPIDVSSHMERVQDLLCSQEVGSQDIRNDPLTKVFGIDKRGRVRGVGNIVSRSQIISSLPALEKLAMKDKEVAEQSSMVKNLESQVDCMRAEQKELKEEFKGLKQLIEHSMTSESQASATLPHKNKESVVVSNTIGNDQSPLTLRPCKMMSWQQEVVALGRAYIENGPQRIHSKSLPAGYYKVSIDVIEKSDVELPYPDGFHSTLGEVGNGSFVAWPEVFTIFTD